MGQGSDEVWLAEIAIIEVGVTNRVVLCRGAYHDQADNLYSIPKCVMNIIHLK